MLDGVISWLPTIADAFFAAGVIPARGATRLTGKYACYEVYQTRDNGYISLGSNEPHFWRNLCEYLGKMEYIEWQYDDEKQDEMTSFLREQFLLRDRDEWVEALLKRDICVAPVYSLAEVFQDPHVLHRKMVFEMEHPRLGKVKQLGFPIKMSATPAQAQRTAPDLGEQNDEILGELGYSADDIKALRQQGTI
jgi:crotonobetainyl-CoA:carnitine CoA-transferase CaiB-like acyl-CoA transferase